MDRSTEKPSQNAAWLLVLPALFVVALCAGLPLMAIVNFSVQDVFPGDVFVWVGAQWFEQVISSPDFRQTLLRSLAFSAVVLAIEIPLGLYIALRMPERGALSSVYLILMSLPLLTPWLVVGFVWKILADSDVGLLGVGLARLGAPLDLNDPVAAWITIIAMDVWHWTSLVVLLCYAGLISIPPDYYQAAKIDGASDWAVFRHIQLPKLRRVLVIAVLLRFIDSFMIYAEPFVVTRGGPGTATTFLSVDLVQTASIQFDLGEASAMSLIYFLVALPASWALFKIMTARGD